MEIRPSPHYSSHWRMPRKREKKKKPTRVTVAEPLGARQAEARAPTSDLAGRSDAGQQILTRNGRGQSRAEPGSPGCGWVGRRPRGGSGRAGRGAARCGSRAASGVGAGRGRRADGAHGPHGSGARSSDARLQRCGFAGAPAAEGSAARQDLL